jgi:general secretion pathway protein K
MVLWVLVLMSIIGMNFLSAGRLNAMSTRNLKDETASYFLALSGFHEAVYYLMVDKDQAADFADNAGGFWVDRDTPPVTGRRTTPDGEVNIQITDEDAKLNINTATPEQLRRLFSYAGVADEAIPEIIDCIMDWKDPNRELHRLQGAKDEYYEGLSEPYKAKNGPFDTPEELALVKGISPDIMYGGGNFKGVLPLITTVGGGSMNINTVSTGVMTMLGLDTYEIEAVMKQRTQETGGFRGVPEQFAGRGLNAMSSVTLKVEVTAKAKNSALASKITAVVQRHPAGRGFRVKTLYWKEREEGIRS